MPTANPDKLKLANSFSLKLIAFGIAQAPNTSRVFFACSDFKVYEADLAAAKFEPKELYGHESYATSVALAGNSLISGGYDGKLIWWDVAANKQIRTIDAHAKWIRKVVVSRDGKIVASVGDDMVCRVWDVSSGKKIHELRGHAEKTPTNFTSMLFTAAFSPDGKQLVTGDKVGHIVIWDTSSGKQIATLEAPGLYTWDPVERLHSIGGIRSFAFSPDGKFLAVGGIGKIGNIDHLEGKPRVEIFDLVQTKHYHTFEADGFKGIVNQLEFAPDGGWLLGAGGAGEGLLLFFDVSSKKALRQEKAAMHIHHFALNPAADTIVAAGHNKIAVYEMKEQPVIW
jgi:WD40 repeat protein